MRNLFKNKKLLIHYRFFQDFKTLADVLIQETIRHDISKIFPQLENEIKGEESNKFENALGERIVVEITENPSNTTKMLEKVLDGNENAAIALTNEIHKDMDVEESLNFEDDIEINSNIGIWIDPIDATSEYISGKEVQSEVPGIFKSGLQCATVLIGVYEQISGKSVIGVINQPFADNLKSRIFYGVAVENFRHSNVEEKETREPANRIAVLSCSESLESSFRSVFAAGAGYKSLKVIEGDADLYFLSKASTFKWDTCAPQAILRALGGNILDMKKSLHAKKAVELNYSRNESSCNEGGIIAYRNPEDVERLLDELK